MKKVLSLLLVLVLALGMSTVSFAAASKVVGFESNVITDADVFATISNTRSSRATDFEFMPGDELKLTFKDGIFVDGDDNTFGTNADITKTEMSKVTPMVRIAKGYKSIGVSLEYTKSKNPWIKVEIKEPFVSNNTDGIDLEFDVYLKIDGVQYRELASEFSGLIGNAYFGDIYADTDYVNFDGGAVATCEEYSKNVEYYLGNGISAFGKAFKGKKYYGWSNDEATSAQADVIDKYDLDGVYNTKNVGLSAVVDYVLLDDVDRDTFVYDGNLKLLGKGNDKLALSEVYYLSSTALDIEDDEPDEGDDVDAPELPADSGGDSDAVIGANDNPSTGA